MPAAQEHSSRSGYNRNVVKRWVAGAAAGNITVTGIKTTDKLLYVGGFTVAEGAPNTFTPRNLTSEFSISAADTINNTGGTSSAGGLLLVEYVTHDAGLG